jgi:hypothetical protein
MCIKSLLNGAGTNTEKVLCFACLVMLAVGTYSCDVEMASDNIILTTNSAHSEQKIMDDAGDS